MTRDGGRATRNVSGKKASEDVFARPRGEIPRAHSSQCVYMYVRVGRILRYRGTRRSHRASGGRGGTRRVTARLQVRRFACERSSWRGSERREEEAARTRPRIYLRRLQRRRIQCPDTRALAPFLMPRWLRTPFSCSYGSVSLSLSLFLSPPPRLHNCTGFLLARRLFSRKKGGKPNKTNSNFLSLVARQSLVHITPVWETLIKNRLSAFCFGECYAMRVNNKTGICERWSVFTSTRYFLSRSSTTLIIWCLCVCN